jgi:hypothetical protein
MLAINVTERENYLSMKSKKTRLYAPRASKKLQVLLNGLFPVSISPRRKTFVRRPDATPTAACSRGNGAL